MIAGQAAIAIQNSRLMSETLEMKRVLESRRLIDRAKGILQYKHDFTEEEAYLRLHNQSRKLRRSMRDLAEAVILADLLHRQGSPEGTPAVREAGDRKPAQALSFAAARERAGLPAKGRH